MNESTLAKEELLTMLIDISDRLEELESELVTSFSDLRSTWWHEEQIKMQKSDLRLSGLEARLQKDFFLINEDAMFYKQTPSLQFDLGFQ